MRIYFARKSQVFLSFFFPSFYGRGIYILSAPQSKKRYLFLNFHAGKGTQKEMLYNLRPNATWLQDSLDEKENDESTIDYELQLFDLDTIIAATNNFSFENELGCGGFGPVFKVASHSLMYYDYKNCYTFFHWTNIS